MFPSQCTLFRNSLPSILEESRKFQEAARPGSQGQESDQCVPEGGASKERLWLSAPQGRICSRKQTQNQSWHPGLACHVCPLMCGPDYNLIMQRRGSRSVLTKPPGFRLIGWALGVVQLGHHAKPLPPALLPCAVTLGLSLPFWTPSKGGPR